MCEGGKVGCVACWRQDYVLGLCCAAIQIVSDFHFVSTDCSINKLIHTFMIKTRISHVERTLLFPEPVGPITLERSHALAALQWKSIRNDNIGRLRVIHDNIIILIFDQSFKRNSERKNIYNLGTATCLPGGCERSSVTRRE